MMCCVTQHSRHSQLSVPCFIHLSLKLAHTTLVTACPASLSCSQLLNCTDQQHSLALSVCSCRSTKRLKARDSEPQPRWMRNSPLTNNESGDATKVAPTSTSLPGARDA
eukprot:4812209-Amphidinium_carterae.1